MKITFKKFFLCLVLFFVFLIPLKALASSENTYSIEGLLPIKSELNVINEKVPYVEGEVLVKYKKDRINLQSDSGRSLASALSVNFSMDIKEEIKGENLSLQLIKDGKSVEEKIKELEKDPNIEYAEPNYKRYLYNFDDSYNDPFRNNLWGLYNYGQLINTVSGTVDADIDLPEALSIYNRLGAKDNVIVAIIDDGVSYNHPDLVNMMWDGSNCVNENGVFLGNCNHGYDFVYNDSTPLPTGTHGTHIAGTIAAEAKNNVGVIGVAPNIEIMAIRFGLDVASEVKAINFAKNNGAKIINASYGYRFFSQAEYDAINSFGQSGGIFVAAAGNDGHDNDTNLDYPSNYTLDNIISVAATNQSDGLATFSNYGDLSVDVGAPGTNIYSTIVANNIWSEDFESVLVPAIGSKFTQSGDYTWGTKSDTTNTNKAIFGDALFWGNYQNNIDSTLTSEAINLTSSPNSSLNFEIFCNTELGYDGILLYLFNGSSWGEAVEVYSGDLWVEEKIDLTNYISNNFQFKFLWHTNESNNDYGCYIDNIRILDHASATVTYQYSNGTSMATPHVVGLAGLVWGHNPTLTSSDVKNIILQSGDTLSSLVGKTVTGKRINAHKALMEATNLSSPTLNTKYFTWYDTKSGNYTWNLVANPSNTTSSFVAIDIGGQSLSKYDLNPYSKITPLVSNLQTGPVKIVHENSVIATQRVLFDGSFNEFAGIPANTLTNDYYFTWNDTKFGNYAWTLIGVPEDATGPAEVEIYIEDMNNPKWVGTIQPGETKTPFIPEIQSGPVRVKSTNGVNFYTTQRVLFDGSFNEFPGIPANTLTKEYYFTWNDTKFGNYAWTLIGVPEDAGGGAIVEIYIDDMDTPVWVDIIAPGETKTPFISGIQSGPVRVVGINNVNFYTTQRVLFDGSFNEFAGIPANTLTNDYYFTWNDTKFGNYAWTLIGVPEDATGPAEVEIYIEDMNNPKWVGTIQPGETKTPFIPEIQSGPVRVKSTNGVNFYTTQRVLFDGSFNELAGITP